MNEKRKKRITSKIMGSILLLVLPKLIPIYYESYYYIGLAVVIGVAFLLELVNWHAKMERRFFHKWQVLRKKGIWTSSLVGMPRPLITMMLIVLLGQFFGNGYTPVSLLQALTPLQMILMIAMLLAFAYLAGIAYWFENEKRYKRMLEENMEQDKHQQNDNQ